MEYTITELAQLAGISSRTLRYYDEIGLLKPGRLTEAGYRTYGQKEIDTLQQILFYRALGLKLSQIKELLNAPNFNRRAALKSHLSALQARKKQLEQLIETVQKTLAEAEGGNTMTDQEKFSGFKRQMIEENEARYGQEARQKYGDKQVDASNARLMQLTEDEYKAMEAINQQLQNLLLNAVQNKENPAGSSGQETVRLHQRWLAYTWGENYSLTAHANLTQMYLDDPRFTAYYDKTQSGCAQFLRDAVHARLAVESKSNPLNI